MKHPELESSSVNMMLIRVIVIMLRCALEQIGCAILWLMPDWVHEFVLWYHRLYLVQVLHDDEHAHYTWDLAERGRLKDYDGIRFVYRLEVVGGCGC